MLRIELLGGFGLLCRSPSMHVGCHACAIVVSLCYFRNVLLIDPSTTRRCKSLRIFILNKSWMPSTLLL